MKRLWDIFYHSNKCMYLIDSVPSYNEKSYVLKLLYCVPILCHREASENISEYPLLCKFHTNEPVTDNDNLTRSLWIRNTVPSSPISINKHLLIPRTP